MVSQEKLFILQLIQKIPKFESWALFCLKGGPKTLVGHIDMHIFRFFVDLLGWPIMQYKVPPTNDVWSLIDEPLIRLWKINLDGSPKLTIGIQALFHIA